jgi:hypothetical protein
LLIVGGSVIAWKVADAEAPARASVAAPARSTTTPPPPPARTLDPEHYQLGPAHPRTGVRYPFDLTVHCGIHYAEFGSRSWKTDRELKAPQPTPDPKTGVTTVTPILPGYMTLVTAGTARFQMPGFGPVTFHVMDRTAPLCS